MNLRTVLNLITATLLASYAAAAFADPADEIIALEKAALDRWGKGDPQGYLDLYAPEVTYFDPFVERRVDGLETMRKNFALIQGKVQIVKMDMIGAKVQRHGDIAILTFNLVDDGRQPDGSLVSVPWNCTEVYMRMGGKWKIIHNHWSYIQPAPKLLPVK